MADPVIAQKGPYPAEVKEGENYYWCSCGKSSKQPYCDGSHQGSDFEPVSFTAEITGTVYLCGCKMAAKKPYCDGTHNKL